MKSQEVNFQKSQKLLASRAAVGVRSRQKPVRRLRSPPTYSPISHNQWTQVGTGQTPVGASHLRAILIQRLS